MNRYFDNGSTSYPKPGEVTDAMVDFATNCGGSYGRSSHRRAYQATSMVEECRDLVGQRLGVADGESIAFTKNATEASNIILSSLDLRGKEVLVSPLEHNCTIRPLVAAGAILKIFPHFADGQIDLSRIVAGKAVLAVINHQSNVNGVIQPISEIREILPIPIMLDTAQSLGSTAVDVSKMDYTIFTGHKGLLGPTGTGGLYVKDFSTLSPLLYGGTGSNSSSFEMPSLFPEFLEAGTHNTIGLAGLNAALKCRIESQHTFDDFLDTISEIEKMTGLELFKSKNIDSQGELFSFRHASIDGSQIAFRLDEEFGIECRFGLHCSALAHETLHTTQSGTVRISLSKYHTPSDLLYFIESLKEILK